jgi:hypothetical protein
VARNPRETNLPTGSETIPTIAAPASRKLRDEAAPGGYIRRAVPGLPAQKRHKIKPLG